jgi:hypothetical protein
MAKKGAFCFVSRKNVLGSIKCFPISFILHLDAAPWWNWYHKLPLGGTRAPWRWQGAEPF